MHVDQTECLRLAATLLGPKLAAPGDEQTDQDVAKMLFALAAAIREEGKSKGSQQFFTLG